MQLNQKLHFNNVDWGITDVFLNSDRKYFNIIVMVLTKVALHLTNVNARRAASLFAVYIIVTKINPTIKDSSDLGETENRTFA